MAEVGRLVELFEQYPPEDPTLSIDQSEKYIEYFTHQPPCPENQSPWLRLERLIALRNKTTSGGNERYEGNNWWYPGR